MFRKFLKRSIPFLVAALVLIGTVAVPVQAEFYLPYEDNKNSDYASFESYLKFNLEVYDGNLNLLGFTIPSVIDWHEDLTRSETYIHPDPYFADGYSMMVKSERASHSYFKSSGSNNPDQLYFIHQLDFKNIDLASDPVSDALVYEANFHIDDFVLRVADCQYGTAFFQFKVPDSWSYVLSYDYYFVVPTSDPGKNIIRGPYNQTLSAVGVQEMWRSFVRDEDYSFMVAEGAPLDSYVLFTNASCSISGRAGDGVSSLKFYTGYGKRGVASYHVSHFFTGNSLSFGEVVDKIVEVPVYDVGIVNFLVGGVGGFLDADIFGSFSIGDLLVVIFTILFVLGILKIIS